VALAVAIALSSRVQLLTRWAPTAFARRPKVITTPTQHGAVVSVSEPSHAEHLSEPQILPVSIWVALRLCDFVANIIIASIRIIVTANNSVRGRHVAISPG
jgi:hypothetical protein